MTPPSPTPTPDAGQLLLAKVATQLSAVLTSLSLDTFTDRKRLMAENVLEEVQKFLATPATPACGPESGFKDLINHVISELEPMARQIIHPKDNVFEKMIRSLRAARDYPMQSSPASTEQAGRDAGALMLDAVRAHRWSVWWNDRAGLWVVQAHNQVVGHIAAGSTPQEAINKAM